MINTRTNANYRGNVPFALMCAIIFDLDCPVFQPGCVAIMLRNFRLLHGRAPALTHAPELLP